MLKKLLTAALIGLFFISSAPAFAAGDASAFVQRMGDKALSSLTAKNLEPSVRESRVRDLLRSNFDVNQIAKFAMGPYWREMTDAQKREYMNLFEDMIVKTYSQRFSDYSGQSFKVGKSVEASPTDMVVNSEIIQQGGPPVNVQWRVRNKGGSQKVIDVIVEGVSMSVTQRSDFAATIQKGGGKIDALLASLKDREAASPK